MFYFIVYSLREYTRSESERSFDEVQIRKARLQSLGLAYLSPQNKSLAQSFRYMRNKPTIIAFKTPSLESCEQRPSQNSIGSMSKYWDVTFIRPFSNVLFIFQLFHPESIRKKKQKRVEYLKEKMVIFWDFNFMLFTIWSSFLCS